MSGEGRTEEHATVLGTGDFPGPEELLRSVLEAVPDFIGGLTLDGTFLFLNRLAPGFSASDLDRATVFDFTEPAFHDAVRECIARVVATGDLQQYASVGMGANRTLRHYETRIAPILRGGQVVALTVMARDITERLAVEEQLRQSQKMEAVGQLTAGIAHNFNNLLMAILPNLELALRVPEPDSAQLIEDARRAAESAATLVRQLLLFAGRRGAKERKLEDLSFVVDRTLSICRSTFDPRIEIELTTFPDVPPVALDAGQIEQVLLNVCLNARDAMESVPAPVMRVSVEAMSGEVTEGAADRQVPMVRIRVGDNGRGMDSATRRRVFEPFFTTKDIGKGTGLGLATAYAIVEAHHGWMTVESTPGEGTCVSICLPSTG